ncbi:RNA polymerase sigma factor [Microbacterium sp.]|uniref:RNA polymerase sigma factor n=1 Tax=Microbacterium sp. TaxID=51671 RepID=UPI003A9039FA
MTSGRQKERLLTSLLRENSIDVLRFLQRRVGSDDAPDLLGETLLVVWRRVDELPDDSTEVRMWLFGVARGVLLNYRRSEKRRLALIDRVRQHMPRTPASPAADEGHDVRDAVDRLPPELAEVVQLVHWDGFTLVEAAAIVGIAPATMRSRYARAKAALRALLVVAPDVPLPSGR